LDRVSNPVQPTQPDIRLALIGVGAIGSALLPRLLRMPFTVITLVDGDRVEEKNLDRKELYAPVDIGRPKVDVAAAWARNAPVIPLIETRDHFLGPENAEGIIAMHDIVADCTDDAHARRLIDKVCGDYGVALVSGAVHGKQGQVIVLHAEGENDALSLPDLFSGRLGEEQDGCDMRHVPIHVLEEVAKHMAWRIRELLNNAHPENGRIEQYDGDANAWMEIAPPLKT
jgi:molybdopterin/thiamine biosynthesis adenylyltransferase